MRNNSLFFCVLLLCGCVALWAGGNREKNESRTATDPGGFSDSIDISEHKPGKYNFYLEATDKAGNVSRAGPDNIFIDPASDLPMATIINPLPNMRVQGNLNIVGIAMDDDGVGYVEYAISRANGEEVTRVRASGAEYWSSFLDTTNDAIWTDGVYTITAWAVDINGLSGIASVYRNGTPVSPKSHKKHQVSWHLDRKNPETIVTSHDVGALVSGNIRLRGNVIDGNGISSFSYSVDGGNRYSAVRTTSDRRSGIDSWDIAINTRAFDDGPAVIWFKAVDGQGSVGTAAHLLFVNNAGPNVEIMHPPPTDVVNGIFTVAGYASHPVGLKSVSWKADKANGEFDMVTGNPWWSTEIDLRGSRASSVEVEIRAVDVSGNTTVKRQRYRVNQAADLPVVTLQEPSVGVVLGEDGKLVVKGSAIDDDGVASVFYSVGGGAAVEIPTSGYFQFAISGIPEGTHNLDIWAKDITGVIGPRVQVKGVVVPGAAPEPRIVSFSPAGRGAIPAAFHTGMTITPEHRSMELTVKSSTLASAAVAFGNSLPVQVRTSAGRDGLFRATVPVPALSPGFTRIELRATDRQGREVVYNEYVIVTEAYNMPFTWIRPNMTADGRILLGSSLETVMGLSGRRVSWASIQGDGSEHCAVEVDAFGRVLLQARQEGSFGPLTLTHDGVDSSPFMLLADFSGPAITLQESLDGKWVQTSVPLSFNVSGRNRVAEVTYSIDMGVTWHTFEAAVEPWFHAMDISQTIDISGMQDGAIYIIIRAVGEYGRETVTGFTVFKDTVPPAASLVMPVADARVNGTIRMGFSVQEAGSLKSVAYYRPASAEDEEVPGLAWEVFRSSDWKRNYAPIFIEVLMDSMRMPLDQTMRFVFEDEAGNSSEVSFWPFIIDTEMDIPEVHIVLPAEDEVITTDFIVSGVMFDDDAIQQIYWKIDDGEESILVAEHGF